MSRAGRIAVVSASILAVTALASCSPDDDPTSATAGAGGVSEIEAKLMADAPPEDLTWEFLADVPTDWTQLEAGEGEIQWRVGDSRCAVLLAQPAGVGSTGELKGEDFARHYASAPLEQAGVEPVLDPVSSRMYPALVNVDHVELKVRVAELHFTDGSGEFEGDSYGYRSGDFALVALATCGGGDYAERSSEMLAFVQDGLAVNIVY